MFFESIEKVIDEDLRKELHRYSHFLTHKSDNIKFFKTSIPLSAVNSFSDISIKA